VNKVYSALFVLLVIRLAWFWLQPQAAGPGETVSGPEKWKVVVQTRSQLIRVYRRVLPAREADLLIGIVLGGQGIDVKLKRDLAATGLTHIVAASGMNVTFITGLVMWLISLIRLPPWLRVILGSGAIFFYACLAGLGPPIVRAMIMGILTLITMAVGRQNSGWVGLGIAAFLMLWASPDLAGSPSFLLSFAAMASQISLSAIRIKVPKLLEPVIGNFLQSLTAIVFTLPIVIIFFAQFSVSSLLTNVLVLWTIEPLMVLGACVGGLGLIFTEVSRVFSWPALALLKFFLWVVASFSGPAGNVVHLSWTDPVAAGLFTLGYYLLLTGVSFRLYSKRR
jgi:competence protein ComEC